MSPDEYKTQCQRIADLYKEAAETGRPFQALKSDQFGARWTDTPHGPALGTGLDWRVKPEPKKFWIVWRVGVPSIVTSEKLAEQTARLTGGTIQEITAPE